MVFTLHRYIFKELFRVFVSASLAMTVVLSFASLLRPIQENGISPSQAMHLLGYFIPITLTFVLPMGALFATALIYGRFASDNELDACRASGISITTMVYPGLCLAVMVAISTLVLSFHVVPAFVHRAERTIRDNAKQILFRNIQRKGSFDMPEGGYRIYADKATPEQDLLQGVVITRQEGNAITKIMTAKAAKIEIEKHKDINRVRVTADEFYMLDDTGQAYASKLPIEDEFPSGLRDDVKFKKMEDIKRIKADMTNYPPVRKLILDCRAQLAVEMMAEDITKRIAHENIDDKYYMLENADRKIMFTAAGCQLNDTRSIQLLPPISLIEIDALKGSMRYRWTTNQKANIKLEGADLTSGITVILENASWKSAAGYEGFAPAPRKVYRNLNFPETLTQKLSTQNITEQIQGIGTERSILLSKASAILKKQKNHIDREIRSTGKEITSEIHSRLVFGLGCVVLILTSSALGIMLKGGHLLTAFGTSALPAGVLIVFIMSGKQLAKGTDTNVPDSLGVLVMWSGFLLLSIFTAWIYRKLTRA